MRCFVPRTTVLLRNSSPDRGSRGEHLADGGALASTGGADELEVLGLILWVDRNARERDTGTAAGRLRSGSRHDRAAPMLGGRRRHVFGERLAAQVPPPREQQ